MNYVGKLFSNVRGFYNEINPATLTGAIDVVVIRQSDGTYVTSPWHVRFGKMGVIRARQKVVDIEINGEPAELHMKLGEAGEAFFVQETEDTAEVPAYLATSPISPMLCEMEEGIAAMKLTSQSTPVLQDDAVTPVIEHGGTIVTLENGKVVVSGIPTSVSTTTLVEMADDRQYFSDSDMSGTSAARRRRHATVGTQTQITSSDIADPAKQDRPITPPCEWYAGLLTQQSKLSSTLAFESLELASVTSTASSKTVVASTSDVSNSCPATPRTLVHRIAKLEVRASTEQCSGGLQSTVGLNTSSVAAPVVEDCVFEMDLSDDERPLPPTESNLSLANELSTFGRCVSLPTIHDSSKHFDAVTDSWAANQYTTTTMCNYTPNDSPFGSRPTSPQSDSGIMCRSQDATSQTHLTGDRLMPVDDINWCWGEFPESSSSSSFIRSLSQKPFKQLASEKSEALQQQQQKPPEVEATDLKQLVTEFASTTTGNVSGPTSEIKDATSVNTDMETSELTVVSEASSVSCKLEAAGTKSAVDSCIIEIKEMDAAVEMEPITDQKKPATSRKVVLPEKDGIYLDDLSQDEPELAALYLYNHKRSSPPPQRTQIMKDEDSESGRGASLPQSPVTVESDSHESNVYQPAKRHASLSLSNNSTASNVSISLCGPLEDQEAQVSDEKFNQHLVTHEALCDNPAVISDPNLVIRIGNKYYNWAIAGPLLLSKAVFNKPLNDASLTRLVLQHLPKKETANTRRGWRFWRRGDPAAPATATSTVPTATKDSVSPASSHPSSPPDTPQKAKNTSKASADVQPNDEESDVHNVTESAVTTTMTTALFSDTEDSATMLQPRDRCRKSLKLTSEQIEKLRLNDGVNEATFSVTTQYQGTTRCHCNIYLWNWDDRIVVSDIDGTITKSDVLGQVLPMIGSMLPIINNDWSQAGIAQLYQMIHRNGYKFLYLSARAIGQSNQTRYYLRSVKQSDISLPDGPLLLSPSSLMSAFHKEVIERKPEQFKISCLRDISALFPPTTNPFCAGFGNKINDVWAYREVGIPISRIFTVNHKGELRMDSTQEFCSSYTRLSDLVDHMFPPLHQCEECLVNMNILPGANEYSSFTYWRSPVHDLGDELASFIKIRDAPLPAPEKKNDSKKGAVGKKAPTAAVTAAAAVQPKAKAPAKSTAKVSSKS